MCIGGERGGRELATSEVEQSGDRRYCSQILHCLRSIWIIFVILILFLLIKFLVGCPFIENLVIFLHS